MKYPNWSGAVRQSSCALVRLMLLYLIVVPCAASAEPGVPEPPTRSTLDALVQEALARSPTLISARKHWQALTKVPIQASTLPDPTAGLQQLTVGSPQPFSGYETSDFYYTGFGVSQDIPGLGKLGLRAKQAEQEAETAHAAYLEQQRQVAEQVRENYFNLFLCATDARFAS
jgi:outer membrane protein, heavy metal efflux system